MKTPSFDPHGLHARPRIAFRRLRLLLQWCACWCVVLIGGWSPVQGQLVAGKATTLSASAQANLDAQIATLEADKRARTPAQRKMDSSLIFGLRQKLTGRAHPAVPMLHVDLPTDAMGLVAVDIHGTVSQSLLDAISKLGGVVDHPSPKYHAVAARMPLEKIETLAAREDVRSIDRSHPPIENVAPVTGEGVPRHRADFVQSNYIRNGYVSSPVTGENVKVGVISGDDDYLQQAENTTDLPTNVTTLSGLGGTSTEGEGTAMMEIVHEMAPDALLYFATAGTSAETFGDSMDALVQAGCQIIIDDITFESDSPLQEGAVEKSMSDYSAQGVMFFSAAGNTGSVKGSTSGSWEGDYNTYGSTGLLDWGGGNLNQIVAGGLSGSSTYVTVSWADPLGNATNDFDMYVTDSSGNIAATSSRFPGQSQDPIEGVDNVSTAGNYYLAVKLTSGSARYLHVSVGRAHMAITTNANIIGHNAATADNAFCVAAEDVGTGTGAFPNGGSSFYLYSSDGPRHSFFDVNGNAYTPNDFSSTGGKIFNKPDITAANGVHNSGVYPTSSQLDPFFGTSAAAPHAGAIAALLMSYNPQLTPAQIRTALQSSAIDILDTGYDITSGYGIIMADAAVRAVGPVINPNVGTVNYSEQQGEAANDQYSLVITNNGVTTLNYSLTENTGFLKIADTDTYGSIPPGQTTTANLALDTAAANAKSTGTYSGTITITDDSAVATPATVQAVLTIGQDTGPSVAVTTPVVNSFINAFSGVSGTASDSAGIQGNTVDFTLYNVNSSSYWTGSGWSSTADDLQVPLNTSTGVWTYTGKLPNASDGTLLQGQYLISAFTYDTNGTVSPSVKNVNNLSFTVDTTPPAVAVTAPANNSTITAASYSFSGTASDGGGLSYINAYITRTSDGFYWNGSAFTSAVNALTTTFSNGTWTCTSPLPQPGSTLVNGTTYDFFALAVDKAGNVTQTPNSVVMVNYHRLVTWTGATLHDSNPNNDSSSWNTAANWSPAVVPGANDAVYIGMDDVDLAANRTVYSLTLAGGSINGYLVTVTGSGSAFTGGTMNSTTFKVAAGASMSIDTSGSPYLYGVTFNNAGTVSFTESNANNVGTLQGDAATINNQSGGVIQFMYNGPYFTSVGNQSILNNSGTVTSSNSGVANLGSIDFSNKASGVLSSTIGDLSITSGNVSFASGSTVSGNGSILFTSPVTVNGTLNVKTVLRFESGATFNAATLVQTGGELNWDGGTWGGTVSIPSGTTLTIDTTPQPQLYGTALNNAGTIILEASSATDPETLNADAATVTNQSGGIIQLTRDGQIITSVGNESTIINQAGGKIVKTTAASGRTLVSANLENSGVVEADAGTLAFDNGSNGVGTSGVFTAAAAAARIEFAGGDFLLNTGAAFAGPGLALVTGGNVTMSGAVTVGSSSVTAGGFELAGGTIDGAGSLSMVAGDGPFVFNTGNMATTLNIVKGATMTVDTTGSPQLYGGTLNNSGTVTLSASDAKNPNTFNADASTINNLSGGVIQLGRDGQLFQSVSTQSVINNSGTVTKSAGTGVSDLGGIDFANTATGIFGAATGTIELTSGTISFASGSTVSGKGITLFTTPVTINGNFNVQTTLRFQNGVNYNAATLVQGTGGAMHWDMGNWSGAVTVPSGTTLPIDTTGSPQLYGTTFNNSGTVMLSASDSKNPNTFNADAATINNLSGGVIQLGRDGQLFQSVSTQSVINNSGTVTKSAGTGVSDLGGIDFANTASGILSAASGTVELTSGNVSFASGSRLIGPGKVFLLADMAFTGATTASTEVHLQGGTKTFNSGAELVQGAGGLLHLDSGNIVGTWAIPAGTTILADTTGSPQLYGSTLNNSGTLVLSASNASAPNTFNADAAIINNLSGGIIQLARDGQLFQSVNTTSTLSNTGTITKTGGTGTSDLGSITLLCHGTLNAPTAGTILLLSGGTTFDGTGSTISGAGIVSSADFTLNGPVNIAPGGTFEFGADGGTLTGAVNSSNNKPLGAINGPGTFLLTGGTIAGTLDLGATLPTTLNTVNTVFLNGATLNNAGTITVSGGKNPLQGDNATFNNLAGANLVSQSNAYLQSVNTTSSFSNAGTVTLGPKPVIVTTDWTFAQTSTGLLKLAINGTSATAPGFSQLQDTQPVTLGGTIEGDLASTFKPATNASFQVLTFASHTGDFSKVTYPNAPTGTVLTKTTETEDVKLVVALKPAITSALTASANDGASFTYQIAASNNPTSFNATNLPSGLSVDTTTGKITGTLQAAGTFNITISATDAAGTDTETLVLTVKEVVPTITNATSVTLAQGVTFSTQVTATNNPTSYGATGLPTGLSVSASTGAITGTPTTAGTYNATLTATNSAGTGSLAVKFTVNPPAPVVTSATTASGNAGTAFTYQIVATNTPTSFNATGLPAGLSVNKTTGVISGTPTAAGTYTVTLTATNAGGSGTGTLKITIKAVPVITSAKAENAQQGKAFTYQITATNSPTSYGATGLPSGLSISASTGAITGTPKNAGSYTVTLKAINASGTGTATLALNVTASAPVITSPKTATATQGAAFSYQIVASNTPTSYGVTGLPTGYSVNTKTGAISGTTTATGTKSITLKAINSAGTGTATLTLTINKSSTLGDKNGDVAKTGTGTGAKPTGTVAVAGSARIISADVVDAQAGKPFSHEIVVNRNATKFTARDLPDGLDIDASTGLIAGTPTEVGAFKIGLTAKAGGEMVQGELLLKIGHTPVLLPIITSELTATSEAGQPLDYQLAASGNPVSFGAEGLPDGLEIDPYSGLVRGTPTAEGTYQVTLNATNQGGTGTGTLTLTITLAPLPVVTASATVSRAVAGDGTAGIITLNLSAALPEDLAVSYEVAGSAINGTDYRLLKGVQTIKAGRTRAVVRITPQGGNDDGVTRKVVRFILLPGEGYEVAAPAPVEVEIVSGN